MNQEINSRMTASEVTRTLNQQLCITPTEQSIIEDKTWRVTLDKTLQEIKTSTKSRERSITITKLQEAIMWLGMDLKELATPNPYPNFYNR
jgi:hypothetical protein